MSLADALRPRAPESQPAPQAQLESINPLPRAAASPTQPLAAEPGISIPFPPEQAAAIRAAWVFHAAIGDALDTIVAVLAREIAVEIVARELRLAEVDVTEITRRLLAERLTEEPLRLLVSPADAAIVCDLPVKVDPALEQGDAILECREGSFDARLGVRLAAVLERLRL